MNNASAGGMESYILEKIRKSNTTFRSRITTVRCEQAGSTPIEIKPRDVGTDFEGWTVEERLGTKTLEKAIIVAIEILNRA